jgi:hypothetical protein
VLFMIPVGDRNICHLTTLLFVQTRSGPQWFGSRPRFPAMAS